MTYQPPGSNPNYPGPQNPGFQPGGFQPASGGGFQPGPYQAGGNLGPKPDNYLVWSIILTVFSLLCCFLAIIPGIVSIVYATQVDSKFHSGDYQGALNSSKNAKIWTIVSGCLNLISVVLVIVYIVAIGIAASNDPNF